MKKHPGRWLESCPNRGWGQVSCVFLFILTFWSVSGAIFFSMCPLTRGKPGANPSPPLWKEPQTCASCRGSVKPREKWRQKWPSWEAVSFTPVRGLGSQHLGCSQGTTQRTFKGSLAQGPPRLAENCGLHIFLGEGPQLSSDAPQAAHKQRKVQSH